MKKATIEEYLRLHDERRELNRRAEALQKQADKIGEQLIAHVDEHGGKSRAAVTCGFRLAMVSVAGRVSWKDAFIDAQGIEAAELLTKNCPPTERLHVEAV